MAEKIHRGITYTGTGTFTITVNSDLGLQGGVDQDETRWLDGAAGAAGDYPGALTGFQATNTDTTNIGKRNPRLVCLSLNSALADGNTLTLSGEVSKIVSVIGSHVDATAIMGITKTSDLVLTFALKQHDDSAADVSATELWLLLA